MRQEGGREVSRKGGRKDGRKRGRKEWIRIRKLGNPMTTGK